MGSCPGSYQILGSDYRAKNTINAIPCFPPFAHKKLGSIRGWDKH